MVADAGSFENWFEEEKTGNPLNFPEYEEKVAATQEKTGLSEGVTIGECTIYGQKTVLGVIDARFMMGSMGHVVGEKRNFRSSCSAVPVEHVCRKESFP